MKRSIGGTNSTFIKFDENLRKTLSNIQASHPNAVDELDLIFILVASEDELDKAVKIAEEYNLVLGIGYESWEAQKRSGPRKS